MLSKWADLDPNIKRWVVIVGAVGTLLLVMVAVVGDGGSKDRRGQRQETIRNVLTDANTREIGIDSLAAEIKALEKSKSEMERELRRLTQQVNEKGGRAVDQRTVDRELDKLRSQLEDLTKETKALRERSADEGKQGEAEKAEEAGPVADGKQTVPVQDAELTPEDVFKQAAPTKPRRSGDQGSGRQLSIAVYSQVRGETDEIEDDSDFDDALFLPAGSILTGVLINGMDAPTGQGARRDPFPSTLRIQKEAILPNRFRADVRECFLIMSGYGDLSSERAYLRGETLSCVRQDGGVIEVRLNSYAIGEDGKAGVRGRVVSKQGQIITKSLMAGFMSGIADAFDVKPVPVLNTMPGSRTEYQSVFDEKLLQSAAVSGAGKALDRIADFYIQMAEGIFPVIEVDAGRQIDVIMTSGMKLNIRGSK